MFVIVDMGWVTNDSGRHCPTQLAAAKVDSNWKGVSFCSTLIRPLDSSFHIWEDKAFGGAKAIDFLDGRGAYNSLSYFLDWLDEDDVLVWWHINSVRMFEKFVKIILKKQVNHQMITIHDRVYDFLDSKHKPKDTPYNIAGSLGFYVAEHLKYSSAYNVRLISDILMQIEYPQEKLSEPFVKAETKCDETMIVNTEHTEHFLYRYDYETNTIHSKDCPDIIGKEMFMKRYNALNKAVKKKYKPCKCCKKEYNEIVKERSRRIIDQTPYTYIYTPTSDVFHRPDCRCMYYARTIFGTTKFRTAINTGKNPCKICNPKSEPKVAKKVEKQISVLLEKKHIIPIDKEVDKALKRQRIAAEERARKLREENLTDAEIRDVYTLTQPRFAFWAGKGCKTFHIHSCSKINTTSELRGFESYEYAINSGYTPCRHCKPTAKHNATISVPISSKIRNNDRFEDLAYFSFQEGYTFKVEKDALYIETPVGKWYVKKSKPPICIEHINLVVTPFSNKYHKQPRLFLSYYDVFEYIKRHDEALEQVSDKCVSL